LEDLTEAFDSRKGVCASQCDTMPNVEAGGSVELAMQIAIAVDWKHQAATGALVGSITQRMTVRVTAV